MAIPGNPQPEPISMYLTEQIDNYSNLPHNDDDKEHRGFLPDVWHSHKHSVGSMDLAHLNTLQEYNLYSWFVFRTRLLNL